MSGSMSLKRIIGQHASNDLTVCKHARLSSQIASATLFTTPGAGLVLLFFIHRSDEGIEHSSKLSFHNAREDGRQYSDKAP
jgi:hypothetical protein